MKYRLHTSKINRMLGGVCGGLAESLEIDVTITRVISFLLCSFQPFFIVVYFILSVTLPSGKGEILSSYKPPENKDNPKDETSANDKENKQTSYTEKRENNNKRGYYTQPVNESRTSSNEYSQNHSQNFEYPNERSSEGNYTGDYTPKSNKGSFNTVIAVMLICVGIAIFLSRYVFGYNLTISDVFGFLMVACGLFFLISGLIEPKENLSNKTIKCVVGGILLYSGAGKVLSFFGLTASNTLASSYIFTAATSLWPMFLLAIGITLLIPRKKTAATVWCLFIIALILGSVIIWLFGSFTAFLLYLGL